MNSVGVNDGKRLSTELGICARIGGVMAELEDITCLSEGGFLEKRSGPFLGWPTRQNHTK